MGKVLRFSKIDLSLDGAAGKPVKLVEVTNFCKKPRMFSLIFFFLKNDSYLLKLICFLEKNLVFKILTIKKPHRTIFF